MNATHAAKLSRYSSVEMAELQSIILKLHKDGTLENVLGQVLAKIELKRALADAVLTLVGEEIQSILGGNRQEAIADRIAAGVSYVRECTTERSLKTDRTFTTSNREPVFGRN